MGTRSKARLPFAQLSDDFLEPRDPVLGYVKIGGKEEKPRFAKATGKPWLAPVRFVDPPRFEVTTREKIVRPVEGRGKAKGQTFPLDFGYKRDEEYHQAIGDNAPTALRVRLMYPEPEKNLIAFLGAYGGGKWVCRGDGVEALDVKRGTCVCPCPRLPQFEGDYDGTVPKDKLQCRPHGQLNVLLEDAQIFGGFWAFKTTSFETISNLLHVLRSMREIFGRVDGLPFELRVQAATKGFGGDGGMTAQPIVTLVLAASMDTARQIASDAAAESQKYLPVGEEEAERYAEAVVEEIEQEVESYSKEFTTEEELEAAADEPEEDELEDDEGPHFEVVEEGAELELEDEDDDEPAADTAEAEQAVTPEEERPPSPAEDLGALEQLCRDVLKEAGYDQEAIDGRVGYHKGKGELEKLRAGLETHTAEAYAKVTAPGLDLEAGPPDDGLDIE